MTIGMMIFIFLLIAFLIIIAGIFLSLTITNCVKAALNAKPTTNNYGEVKNYFINEQKENLTATDDEKFLLLAECAGKFLQAVQNASNDKPVRKSRTLKK